MSYRVWFVLLALSLSAGERLVVAGCSDVPDHLEPADAMLASFNHSFDYQTAVRKVLLKGQSDKPYFRVVGLPAFFPEWSLTIDEPVGGRAKVEFAVAKKSIYKGEGYRTPSVKKAQASVDANLAKELRGALTKMLLDTRPCATLDGRMGVDGVTYSFSSFIRMRGVLSGETWSPNDDTRAGQMVATVRLLIKLVLAGTDEQSTYHQQLIDSAASLKRQILDEKSPS